MSLKRLHFGVVLSSLYGADCHNIYWHHIDNVKCVHYRRQHGGSGSMVWGCFSYNAPCNLVFVKDNLSSSRSCGMLEQHFLSYARPTFCSSWAFQQDNCPSQLKILSAGSICKKVLLYAGLVGPLIEILSRIYGQFLPARSKVTGSSTRSSRNSI